MRAESYLPKIKHSNITCYYSNQLNVFEKTSVISVILMSRHLINWPVTKYHEAPLYIICTRNTGLSKGCHFRTRWPAGRSRLAIHRVSGQKQTSYFQLGLVNHSGLICKISNNGSGISPALSSESFFYMSR